MCFHHHKRAIPVITLNWLQSKEKYLVDFFILCILATLTERTQAAALNREEGNAHAFVLQGNHMFDNLKLHTDLSGIAIVYYLWGWHALTWILSDSGS